MEARQRRIIDLFSQNNTQFTIPVYQRNYSWTEKECKLLFNDIFKISYDEKINSHFIGSVVYIHEGVYKTGVNIFNIIDGQQRMTTLTLLFIAICHSYKKLGVSYSYKRIFNRYIIDEYLNEEEKLKLVLPDENLIILKNIINQNLNDLENYNDRNLIKNYKLFLEYLYNYTEKELDILLVGIEKLIYVDIALEKGRDDPQKIFESLNSTGLDLTQSDLIRNFILMDLEREEQNRTYKEIWIPIENNCNCSDGTKISSYISEFIRDYLTLKNNKITKKAQIFEDFKEFYKKNKNILEELKKYSEIYSIILKPEKEKDKVLSKELKYLKVLDQTVINPFLIGILKDYKEENLDKSVLIKILELLESYILRRYIVGEPSNALNKIFKSLYMKLEKENYYNSFAEIIVKQNFPNDEILKQELKIKPLYKDKSKLNYIFEKLENYYHNEVIDFENDKITIEHIFPQNPNKIWEEQLTKEEYDQMVMLKDTISNLTLTGSNINLSNKSFLEKRNLENHGYKDSKLYINKWLGDQDEWNILKMNERFELLFNDIIKIWKRPEDKGLFELDEKIFLIKGPRGMGSGKLVNKEKFIVLKGTRASKEQTQGIGEGNRKTIEKLLKNGIIKEFENHYIFEKDYVFSSPSAAAKFILGRSANGWTEWKTYDGKLLDDYRE